MITRAAGLALFLLCTAAWAADSPAPPQSAGLHEVRQAGGDALSARPAAIARAKAPDFGQQPASSEVRRVAHWVIDSNDHGGLPFVIVDKVDAKVFVFDRNAVLQGAAPALLGLERGDGSVAGIGSQKMSAIRPQDRTTPAGRFVSSLGPDLHGQDILWIDYDNAIALHRVVKGTPAERRAQRLDSATPDDNRISFGCINVPVKFFEAVVRPAFLSSNGIVYILPETRTAHELFGAYEVTVDSRPPDQAKQP